jgi:hypothetical protein
LRTEVSIEGHPLYIQVSDEDPSIPTHTGPVPAGVRPAELLGRLDAVGAAAGEACVALFGRMRHQITKAGPKEVTIEFGLTLGGEAGVPFVTKGTGEGAFKISAKWELKDPRSSQNGGSQLVMGSESRSR